MFGRRSPLTRWFPANRWSTRFLAGRDHSGDEPFAIDCNLWKGIWSQNGGTKIKFHAAFDVPGTPDPHCDVFVGTV